jgi:hypothetical protein
MIQTQVLIQLPTEISYWGSTATESDVSRICDNLESMIRAEFGERLVLLFERTATPLGDGVSSEHEDWIANNWTAAL